MTRTESRDPLGGECRVIIGTFSAAMSQHNLGLIGVTFSLGLDEYDWPVCYQGG
jgi:hypothetical protein